MGDVLGRIAAEMFEQAGEKGKAQHSLEGGLTLTLLCRGESYSLSLSRYLRQSSRTERRLCRAAFGVPTWVSERHITITYQDGWGIWRVWWTRDRGRKIRAIAQGHLAPGLGLHGWRRIMERHGLRTMPDWDKCSDEELDQIIVEIFARHKTPDFGGDT